MIQNITPSALPSLVSHAKLDSFSTRAVPFLPMRLLLIMRINFPIIFSSLFSSASVL